ncbi:MAG: hypothetical protein ABII13_01640 [Patescibacteria group bacterium]|nr:hypothetical protein [Patescibacteria group bacterium]MBU2509507.1 hypothetical protein [Patescibacteria group bacterium]
MKLDHRVYGEIQISEPVIIELINCPALQRLKEIDQAGYFEPHYQGSSQTRFEHSIGDYYLLTKYGALLEERIAGLIHDVSHAAFSHCIDYVLDEGSEKEQTYQDNVFVEFVKNTEIPSILKKYDLDPDFVSNEENFSLQERNLPDLCADRIDYTFLTAIAHKAFDRSGVNYFLDNLIIQEKCWVFRNFESAKKFADLYLKFNNAIWSGMPSAIMFRTVGDYLKYSIQKGYISKDDLYTTNKKVLSKINTYLEEDEKLRSLFDRMNLKIGVRNDPQDYDAHIFCKSRVVDPLCMHEGAAVRISDVDPSWRDVITQQSKPKEYFLKFER